MIYTLEYVSNSARVRILRRPEHWSSLCSTRSTGCSMNEIKNFFSFRGSWNGVSRCASCCLIDLQHLQYNVSMFICLSWIVPFFLFNIDVAIMTQQYLSFQRILKRSAFASHSICIENIVDLIILNLPVKSPKAGKVYLSIFFFNACVSTWT